MEEAIDFLTMAVANGNNMVFPCKISGLRIVQYFFQQVPHQLHGIYDIYLHIFTESQHTTIFFSALLLSRIGLTQAPVNF